MSSEGTTILFGLRGSDELADRARRVRRRRGRADGRPEPVEVLGIDEIRRGKPRWTKDAEDGRWVKLETFETNFVDLAGSQGLLEHASGRTKANVVAWLDQRGQAWKDAVTVVAIDPCATYRAAVAEALPHALIVAAHFHLVRLANQAVTDVRRRVTWDTHGRRGATPAAAARLRAAHSRAVRQDMERPGRRRPQQQDPHRLDRERGTPQAVGLRPHRRPPARDLRPAAHRFNAWCADSRLPELERLAGTIEAWWPEVLGFLTTGITNAGTEATNRTVKTAARTAYGFHNLDNQRRRVRFVCTRRHRRVTAC